MLKILIGKNSVGKTVLLKKQMDACNSSFASNIDDASKMFISTEYIDKDRVDLLRSLLVAEKVRVTEGSLVCENGAYEVGSKFMFIISLLCVNSEYVFLDEPELGLTREEENLLTSFIRILLSNVRVNIVITTHSEAIVNTMFGDCVYEVTLDNGNLLEHSIEGVNIYEVLDSI